MEDGSFWNDPVVSQNKMKTLKSLKDDVATYEKLATQFDDIETLIEMGYEENDASLIPEIEEMLNEFVTTFDNIRIKTLLSGEDDGDNAILSLHAGAGGTESCDWAQMLFRMYSKWADSRGYELVVLDSLDGDEAGIKSITFQINGENAYGYLKSEKACTVWSVFLRLMRLESARHLLYPVMLCRISRKISTLRSMKMT